MSFSNVDLLPVKGNHVTCLEVGAKEIAQAVGEFLGDSPAPQIATAANIPLMIAYLMMWMVLASLFVPLTGVIDDGPQTPRHTGRIY